MAARLSLNATTSQINEFLEKLDIASWRIHQRIVEFNDAKDRDRKIVLLRNKLLAEGFPKDVAENQAAELRDADTILVGIKSLKQKGSILMMCGDWEKDLQQAKPSNEVIKHVVLLFLKEKKLYIYDPGFERTEPRELTEEEKEKMKAEKRDKKDWRPRLGEFQGGARVRHLYKGIKNKFAVEEIWIGGGGNGGLNCLHMCQALLELMENGNDDALNLVWAEEEMRE